MRIVVSEQFQDPYIDVTSRWSFADQLHAHRVLDCIDDIRDIARPPPPRKGA